MKNVVRKVVLLPEGFSAEVDGKKVTVRSPAGELSRRFKAKVASFKKEDNHIVIEAHPVNKKTNAIVNTIVSHMKNMVSGLQHGFEYRMAVVFSHFPMNASVKGSVIEINNFAGEKHARIAKVLPGVSVEVKGKDLFVRGQSKEAVGQTAANIESATRVRGKDKRIFQDGIFLIERTVMQKSE